MISVYPSNERNFADNGIKVLKPLEAIITKEDNGNYYIDLKDNVSNLQYYQAGMIIRANTPWGYQCFRLTNPDIQNNVLDVRGYHLYYDIANYLIADSYVVEKNCNAALDHLKQGCDVEPPFTLTSDITRINSYRCVRNTLEEALKVVIERWGGHLVRDNWSIEIRNSIGQDRGVNLVYGRDITSISQTENWDDVITKILPVGKDGITLPEIYIELEDELYDIPYSKIISFDQSEINQEDYVDEDGNADVESYTEALLTDLRNKANEYLENNKLPKVNYSVNTYITDISDIGDTIYVKHPRCKIDLITNVIAIEYDCILNKYTRIEFGNFREKLQDLMTKITNKVENEVNQIQEVRYAKLENELQTATNKIWGAMGSSYVLYDGSKILVVDTLPKENATNVIMINNGGIGFSNTGINGTFRSAWTIDGTLDMQNINVINLVADMIKGGTLKLGSNLNESGIIELYDESNRLISTFDKNGLIFYCDDNSYIKINPEVGFAGYNAQNVKTYWVDGDEFHQRKSVVEEEITIASKIREIPITITNNGTIVNDGIGYVPLL